MTSNEQPRRGRDTDDQSKGKGKKGSSGGAERSREPLGDVAEADLTEEETGELAREIEAERDA